MNVIKMIRLVSEIRINILIKAFNSFDVLVCYFYAKVILTAKEAQAVCLRQRGERV